MNPRVKSIPDGYHSVTPYLILDDAAKALEFYKNVFGATELMRIPGREGKIGHAEIQIGNSRIMLADPCAETDARGPASYGGSPMFLMLYVDDADAMIARAIAAGAELTQPIEDKFYGDRSGMIADPFGYDWAIATHIEDVPPEELGRRMAAMGGAEVSQS